ncbi:hypothetical protein [Kribbella sp. CA-247076]|uniref:hypothetical protein n=1 Tax=Kribbella sp. CA-247076 TaxID=3239941 RepID=UPI003D8B5928
MAVQELEELKSRVQGMREQLDTITDEEWLAYVKVRDILALDPGFGGEAGLDNAVRCAMLGIFETSTNSGSLGEYDAGVVGRFAHLGE